MPSTRSGKQSTPVTHPSLERTKKDVPNHDPLIMMIETARNNEPSPPNSKVEPSSTINFPGNMPHCQELADKYIFDILDYIAEQILRNQQNRIFQYEVLTVRLFCNGRFILFIYF
jgi:hypothetical protein